MNEGMNEWIGELVDFHHAKDSIRTQVVTLNDLERLKRICSHRGNQR